MSLATDDIQKLPDYLHEIDRIKLRFNGIGPRLHERPGKLWPRDCLSPQDECRKIIYPELRSLINSEQKIQLIEDVITQAFEGLRKCNTTNLFNKFCALDVGYFDQIPFTVVNAMEAYTNQAKIHDFIHQAIRSINQKRSREGDFVVKLFGCHRNYDIYKQHVKWLVNGNLKLRRLVIGHFVHFTQQSRMDLGKVDWLRGLEPAVQYRVFIQTIYAITRFITELLRRYFYITVSNPYANKLFYFRYDLWQKLQTKVINYYESVDLLYKFRMDSSINLPEHSTSKLKFYLKRDNVRMICTKQRGSKRTEIMLTQLRTILLHILNRMPNFEKFSLVSLLRDLKEFREQSKRGNKRIYFVRADVENCFQSIKQDVLKEVILDNLRQHQENHCILRLLKISCTVRDVRQRKTSAREISRWVLETELERVALEYEQVRVINKLDLNLERFENEYLCPQIINPVLKESKSSKNAYNLLQGIRQGSLFSPLLCSIYIQHAFNEHMSHIIQSKDCKLFRYVDDILLMTTDLDKARRFMQQMINGLPEFALHSNASKLACNFDCGQPAADNLSGVQRLQDYVLFYKRKIALVDLHCTYHYSYNDNSIENTFHVSPYFNQTAIYNSIINLSRIELIHLDFELNGVHQVVENIYESALLTAHRTATLLIVSFVYKSLSNQQTKLLTKLLNRIAHRILRTIDSGLDRNLIVNNLSFRQVRLLILAAYLATWRSVRLRHRKRELDKLEKLYKRSMMDYLVATGDDVDNESALSGIRFQEKVSKLIKNFPTSAFSKEVILPTI